MPRLKKEVTTQAEFVLISRNVSKSQAGLVNNNDCFSASPIQGRVHEFVNPNIKTSKRLKTKRLFESDNTKHVHKKSRIKPFSQATKRANTPTDTERIGVPSA